MVEQQTSPARTPEQTRRLEGLIAQLNLQKDDIRRQVALVLKKQQSEVVIKVPPPNFLSLPGAPEWADAELEQVRQVVAARFKGVTVAMVRESMADLEADAAALLADEPTDDAVATPEGATGTTDADVAALNETMTSMPAAQEKPKPVDSSVAAGELLRKMWRRKT